MNNTQTVIQDAFDQRDTLDIHNTPTAIKDAIHTTIQSLSDGSHRVASKDNGQWVTHEWLKKAIWQRSDSRQPASQHGRLVVCWLLKSSSKAKSAFRATRGWMLEKTN